MRRTVERQNHEDCRDRRNRLIGSKVVGKLNALGHQAIAAAPNTGVDIVTGHGLAEVLEGADVVVDMANSPSLRGPGGDGLFQAAGKNIAAAEKAAGVKHHVALSVVGTEKCGKTAAIFAPSSHRRTSFVQAASLTLCCMRRSSWSSCGALPSRPSSMGKSDCHTRSSSRWPPRMLPKRLWRSHLGKPAGRTIEIGGPEKFHLDEIISKVLAFDKDPRKVVVDPDARYFGVKLDDDSLIHRCRCKAGPDEIRLVAREHPAPAAQEMTLPPAGNLPP